MDRPLWTWPDIINGSRLPKTPSEWIILIKSGSVKYYPGQFHWISLNCSQVKLRYLVPWGSSQLELKQRIIRILQNLAQFWFTWTKSKKLFEIFRKSKSFFLKSLIRVLETVSQIQLSFPSKKVVFGTEFDFLQHQLSNLTNNVNHTRFTISNHG